MTETENGVKWQLLKGKRGFFVIIKRIKEARKMTQQFRALAAFTEDKGLILSTHITTPHHPPGSPA